MLSGLILRCLGLLLALFDHDGEFDLYLKGIWIFRCGRAIICG